MMKHKKSICIIALFLSSCGGGEWDTYLHVQRIPNSNKVIYEYDAWGGRDSHQFGIVIMDSTEDFEVNKVRNLPISYFTEVPNSSQIHAISLQKAGDDSISLNPVANQEVRISDIHLEIDNYKEYSGYSDAGCILNEYRFQTFKETEDSLYLFGLQKIFGVNLEGKENVGFQKGNIKLITDSNGKLMRLEIKELFKGKANKHKYKKSTAEVIERKENSPVVCLRTYYFKPLKTFYSDDFTDYGIFKPIINNTVPNQAHEQSFGYALLTSCTSR
ncbi:hypothetical protein [Pontibacter harenae]|uniref:hypothetical protein n=1 Tax=Pontibacter harenae TaxID=2894083 RepID=UPI001E5145FB|nr:hypothetical protein [Pontibacter harenae]MCC9167969.1 hypothetical protein [Pontibacter harenae]